MMSLRRTTVLLIASLLAGTGMLIGSVAYFTTRASLLDLRDGLIAQTNDAVLQRMQFYFGQAAPALEFVDQMLTFHPQAMEKDQWQDIGLQLALFLDSQLEITWIYFAEADTGNLLGAVRDEEGRLLFTRIHTEENRSPVTMQVLPDGKLKQILPDGAEIPAGYDARERPWFATGMASPARTVAWTPPYDFLGSGIRGVTATLTRRDAEGKALHVIGADLDLSETGAFLDSLMIGKTGAAFLMDGSGTFLSTERDRPNPRLVPLRRALESQAQIAGVLNPEAVTRIPFSYEDTDYLAVFQPTTKPDYYTAIILPEDDYLAPVRRNALITVALGIAILGLAGVLGVFVAARVTAPLDSITRELEEIGELRFPEEKLAVRSSIREIERLGMSVKKMQSSLLSFSRYVPKRLLRRLLAKGVEAKLGGQLRRVTVQFTDLAGFTRLSESLTPEEAFDELHEFLEIITGEQHQRGGITSSFTGDGTLALFNAPDSLPGHERLAVEAALACVEALEICNARRKTSRKAALHARIGVNTCEVLVGNLGTDERFAYTAVGDGVNLASRLEGLNKLYGTQILAGNECRHSTGEEFDWRMIDCISVIGRNQPTEIHEPLGRRGETDDTILQLRDAYEAALRTYFAGDFAAAIAQFEAIVAKWPVDGPTACMLQRCRELLASQPNGSDWDGSFAAPFK